MVREIVFDTETTGLSPEEGDRLVEIGAVELIVQYMIEIAGHIEYPIRDAPQLIAAA